MEARSSSAEQVALGWRGQEPESPHEEGATAAPVRYRALLGPRKGIWPGLVKGFIDCIRQVVAVRWAAAHQVFNGLLWTEAVASLTPKINGERKKSSFWGS